MEGGSDMGRWRLEWRKGGLISGGGGLMRREVKVRGLRLDGARE